MRAIANFSFQLILACALLLCITCNYSDDERVSGKSEEAKVNDDAFIINQIHNAYDLIELAEIAEQKGTRKTSLRATALKDNQISILYLFTDFANQRRIKVPGSRENHQTGKMYLLSRDFDAEWNRIINQQTKQTVEDLEEYFLRADKDSRRVIAEVLATIQSESSTIQNNVASNN